MQKADPATAKLEAVRDVVDAPELTPAAIGESQSVGEQIITHTAPSNTLHRLRDMMYPTRTTKEGDTYLDVRNSTFDYAQMADFLIDVLDMKVFCSREKPDIPSRLAVKIDGRYITADNFVLPKAITYIAGKTVKRDGWQAVADAIKVDGGIEYYLEDIDHNTRKANFMNGVVDISGDTIKLIPHNDKDIFFTRIPHEYAPGYECPVFQEFLDYALDQKYHQFIYEWIGYCFFETNEFQSIVFHHGVQAGGKSTLLNMISTVLGPSNVSGLSLKECSREKFKLSALSGALANHGSEVSYKDLKDGAEILKRLSSGVDPIMMERKYKDAYPVVNTAKLTYAMNNLPQVYHDDGGVWRRLKLVKWEKPIDPEMGRYFNSTTTGITSPSEVRGVICKAIEAFHAMLQRDDVNFSYTQDIEATREEYAVMSDPLGEFVFDRVVLQNPHTTPRDMVMFVSTSDMYESYTRWCADHSIKPQKIDMFKSRHGIAKTLWDEGKLKASRETIDGVRVRGYEYVSLRMPEEYLYQDVL